MTHQKGAPRPNHARSAPPHVHCREVEGCHQFSKRSPHDGLLVTANRLANEKHPIEETVPSVPTSEHWALPLPQTRLNRSRFGWRTGWRATNKIPANHNVRAGLENRFGPLGPTRVQIPPPPLLSRSRMVMRFLGVDGLQIRRRSVVDTDDENPSILTTGAAVI